MKRFQRLLLLPVSVVLFVGGLVMSPNTASAQCDTIITMCAKHINDDFISDGQIYRALLSTDELAEFHATFYGGTTYRIAACSGFTDGNLIFRLYDSERNLLFSNSDYSNSAYWDFRIKSTMEVIIEAELDMMAGDSGCAVVNIGFKQE